MVLVDLHSHTNFSDGQHPLEERIGLALRAQLVFLALTDHDTFAPWSDEAIMQVNKGGRYFVRRAGRSMLTAQTVSSSEERREVKVMQGVELTTIFRGHNQHLVGLGISNPDEEVSEYLRLIKEARLERIRRMCDEINKKKTGEYEGLDVKWEEVQGIIGHGVPSRLHLGYYLSEHYPRFGSPRNAMNVLLGRGLESYHFNEKVCTTEEGIRLIHYLGGLAVLPHPGRSDTGSTEGTDIKGLDDKIEELKSCGLDAMEVNIGEGVHNELIARAKSYRLLCSAGNDDHGKFDIGGRFEQEEPYSGILLSPSPGIDVVFRVIDDPTFQDMNYRRSNTEKVDLRKYIKNSV